MEKFKSSIACWRIFLFCQSCIPDVVIAMRRIFTAAWWSPTGALAYDDAVAIPPTLGALQRLVQSLNKE